MLLLPRLKMVAQLSLLLSGLVSLRLAFLCYKRVIYSSESLERALEHDWVLQPLSRLLALSVGVFVGSTLMYLAGWR